MRDDVARRLEALARREGMSVDAFAVGEPAETSRAPGPRCPVTVVSS